MVGKLTEYHPSGTRGSKPIFSANISNPLRPSCVKMGFATRAKYLH